MAKTKNGFTLVELLVVISIIALLLAILVPTLGKAKKQGKNVVCKSNLRQWGLCFSLYTNDHEGKVWNGATHLGTYRYMWYAALRPYAGYGKDQGGSDQDNEKAWKRDLYFCPEAHLKNFSSDIYRYGGRGDPSLGTDRYYWSYGENMWCYDWKENNADKDYYWRNVTVTGVNRAPLLADCLWGFQKPRVTDALPAYHGELYANGGISKYVISRHLRNTNVVFMDSHVESLRLRKIWEINWHRRWQKDLGNWGLPNFRGNWLEKY